MTTRKKAAITQRRAAKIQLLAAPRHPEHRLAPAKQAERHHARPGAGIKKARAAMAKKPR